MARTPENEVRNGEPLGDAIDNLFERIIACQQDDNDANGYALADAGWSFLKETYASQATTTEGDKSAAAELLEQPPMYVDVNYNKNRKILSVSAAYDNPENPDDLISIRVQVNIDVVTVEDSE